MTNPTTPDPLSDLQRLGQEFDAEVVTQEDREAAAAFEEREPPHMGGEVIRDGVADDLPLVQAFARHRIAAIAAARPMIEAEAFEKAARVAEHLRPTALSPQFYTPDIAAAIRALIEPQS